MLRRNFLATTTTRCIPKLSSSAFVSLSTTMMTFSHRFTASSKIDERFQQQQESSSTSSSSKGPNWSIQKQAAIGLCLGVTVLLGSIVVTEYFSAEPDHSHLHIPDDERTPRQKVQDQSREELYGKGMLSDCTGLGPDFLPLHVARKFLHSDFPDFSASANREHYEKLLFLYVRHVPQFLSFIQNQSVKSATYTDDGEMRSKALREYLGLDKNTGAFNPDNAENTSNPQRAKIAYDRLSNIVPFALNPETNRVEPIPDKTGAVVGEFRVPVQGEYQEKYLPRLQTWERFVHQNSAWRLSTLSIPVLQKMHNFPGTFYQRAIDLTMPAELKHSLQVRQDTVAEDTTNNKTSAVNTHGTPCIFNPVLTLAHYGTIKHTDDDKRKIKFPVSCWCFDAWDVVRQDISTPALTTLLFNSGNLSSIRLIEELYGIEDAEAKLIWNSKFNDETENTSLLPQLEKYSAGLIPSFRLTKSFIEQTRKGKSSFEWDENAVKTETEELAAPYDPKKEAHAMLLLGERKDARRGKTYYLVQNWWEKSQFLEIEREYLMKHIQHNERYQSDKKFVCFVPPKAFLGKALNPFIMMDVIPQVTRQAIFEVADSMLNDKF